jgi:Flp pilus assembly protein TadG
MYAWVKRSAAWPGARWRRRILRFRAHQGGHALLETALLFTILPFLFLGVSEFSEADMVKRRLDEAAGKSADLVARVDSVSRGELDALKDNLIDELMRPFPTAGFSLILTSVVTDQNGRATVGWSHSRGGSEAARPVGSDVVLPAGLAEPSTSVIMAESASRFASTFGTMIVGDRTMTGVAYSAPRGGGQVIMRP